MSGLISPIGELAPTWEKIRQRRYLAPPKFGLPTLATHQAAQLARAARENKVSLVHQAAKAKQDEKDLQEGTRRLELANLERLKWQQEAEEAEEQRKEEDNKPTLPWPIPWFIGPYIPTVAIFQKVARTEPKEWSREEANMLATRFGALTSPQTSEQLDYDEEELGRAHTTSQYGSNPSNSAAT